MDVERAVRAPRGTRLGRAAMLATVGLLALTAPAGARSPEIRRVRDLIRVGEVRAAHRELIEILKRNPGDPDAHFEMGRILISYEPPLYEEAIEHLTFSVEQQPASSDYHLWLGRAWGMKLENSNLVAAALGPVWRVKKHFEEAVRLDPKSQTARVDLFQFYLFAPDLVGGGREKALGQLRALSTESPDAPLAHTAQAILALKQGDYGAAGIAFDRIAQLWPERAGQVYFQMGFILLADGRYGQAERCLQRALQAGTPIDPPHKVLLPDYVRNAFYEKARFEVEHNVRVKVESSSLNREDRLSKRGEAADPEYARLLRLVATIYEQQDHPKLALLYLQRAQALAGKPGPNSGGPSSP